MSNFQFTEERMEKFKELLTRYDDVESAILPVLHLAQEQNGWLSDDVLHTVSDLMKVPVIKLKEVVSFYDMFYDHETGRNVIQVCTNISCSMNGGREIFSGLLKEYKTKNMSPCDDGRLYFQKMECLGACSDAPCMRVNNDYYGKVTLDSALKIIRVLR
jgi:NADH-quinone oxidoreductase subunit E